MTRANSYGFSSQMDLESGIKDTIEWYLRNQDTGSNKRYNPFTEDALLPKS